MFSKKSGSKYGYKTFYGGYQARSSDEKGYQPDGNKKELPPKPPRGGTGESKGERLSIQNILNTMKAAK